MLLCSPYVFRKGLDSKPQLKRDELRRRENVGVLAQMTSKHNPSRGGRERGFTMAELLIVVAIIAVLVAIAIPVFSAQLEKSREAVDLANTRSAYAALQSTKIEGTFPDGSSARDSDVFMYIYTGSGFKAWKYGDSALLSEATKLKSNAALSLLSDFTVMPTQVGAPGNPESVKDCVLMACFVFPSIDPSAMVLSVWPSEWC